MSEENISIKYLQQRIADLEKERDGYKAEAKERRLKLKRLTEDHAAEVERLTAELAELQEAVVSLDDERQEIEQQLETDPDGLRQQITELQGQIKLRDVKDRFADLKPQLADKVDLDKLFSIAGFDPSGVEDLDGLNPDELVGQWREAAPYLFKPAETATHAPGGATKAERQPLRVAETTAGRGARDTTSARVTYSKAEIRRPGWERARPELRDAIESGEAVCLDA